MTAETIAFDVPQGAAAPPLTVVPRPYVPIVLCRCGHEKDTHEHARPGDDCWVCGSVRCRTFRRRTGRGAHLSFRR